MTLYSGLSGQMALKDTEELEERSGDSDSVFGWQPDPSPRYFFPRGNFKTEVIKGLICEKQLEDWREGGREGEASAMT